MSLLSQCARPVTVASSISHSASADTSLATTSTSSSRDRVPSAPSTACSWDIEEQLMDTHSRIDHVEPHCSSRQLYKGILDDASRGVFHGAVVVRPGAQKTDAEQSNRNLLLTRQALVNSTPQLEIFADDVKCRHGATTGQLDGAALFYLRSRGISEEGARSMLTYGFASELVARVAVPEVSSVVRDVLSARLPGAPVAEL